MRVSLSSWAHLEPPGSENTACCALVHLHCDNGGQLTHSCDCGGQLHPECPQVLLPWPLIHECCLFCNSYPKCDYRPTLGEENHFLSSLYNPDFNRTLIWWCWDFPSGDHGLCGHLQTPALYDNHEPTDMCSAAPAGLGLWFCACCSAASLCLWPALLWS